MVRLFNASMGKVRSPFATRLVKRPSYQLDKNQIIEGNKLPIDPPRFIKLGIQLDPNTGQEIGDFYLPFDDREHEPAALIWGGSGSGKSVALARIESEISFNYSRSILIFDFKNQYRYAYLPNDNPRHIEILKAHGEAPRGISNTKCFLPIHVVNKYGDEFCKLTYGYTDTWKLTLNDCDTAGLLMLGQKELEGMAYILFLESAITTVRKRDGVITIASLIDELSASKEEEGTSKKSVDTIIGMIKALSKMGILTDKGNSVLELMHPPRRPGLGGDVFIFNLAGAGPDDIQTRGILINLLNGICHSLKNKINIQPVLAIEEASSFFSREATQNMKTALNQLHYVMGRSLGIFRLYIYQRKNQIPLDLMDDKGVSILIETMNNFQLGNGQQLSGAGIAKVTIRDVTFMPNDLFLVKILPPRCKVS